MFRKYVFVLLALSLVLLPIKAYSAVDDPFWPQSEYDKIESRILDNVPVITDDATSYKFTVVDADGTRKEITYSVNLTDSQFAPYVRTSVEEYYTARPGGAAGSLIVRDNVEDWTWAIRAALDHVANYTNPSGIKGGTVVLPTRAAPYITGAIRFRGDNTRIHLEDGVTINFIRNLRYGTDVRAEPTTMLPPIAPTNYDDWYPQEKTRYECRDIYGFSPLIYAYKLKNIALTGSGRGGDNPVTGDGRNGTEDGSITPEAGSKLSIIDGRADGRNMRISSGPTGPLYLPDNVTSLGTPGTFNMNNTTGEPVVSGGVSYSTYVTNRMNAWEPISSRKIPDLLTASLASADLMQSIAMRRVNRYRPTFIEPHESQNVLISNFYMRNSPFWTVHPEYSNNVRVTGLHINSHGGNNDGCNPDSSQYVLIEGNIFNTGDDCIAIKCGRDNDAYQDWNMSSNHIIVRNNLMFDGHGGLVAGSEMGGGVEWVFSHNNKYDSPYLYWGLRIKTTSNRGGFVRNIYMKDTEAHALEGGLVKLNFYYEADSDNRVPSISDIYISNFSTPATGFTAPPNLGFLTGKQYGSSPINGIHFKDCDFRGFRQSPNSPNHPNRPVNNVICAVEGGITYDNVLIDGEPYQPPAKSSTIKSLLFTRTGTSDIREVTNDEELKAIIDESRNASGMNWDIAIVAKVEGFDYKGKRYNIFDTIENSTFTDSWAGSNHAYRNSLTGTNDGPNLRYADSQYPYYRVNGMPAYEAFVRVGSNSPFADWYVTSGTWDGGPCYVIDLRMPGRVIPMGNNEYLIKLRENVNMGTNTPGRVTGFNALNKVEIILRNALYPEDQDFVFYSHIPRIKATSINVDKKLFTVTFDRPMNTPEYLALLAPLDYKLNSDGSIVPIGYVGQWSADGTSVSYSIPGTIDASKRYTIDAFDPTSKVLSYRGVVPVLSGTAIISLTLNADYILMKAGETFQLVPTIFPSDATLPITYAFTSDNVNVAGVSNSGLVTARAAGSAKITVKASNDGGEATATFNVIVTDPLSDDSSVTPIPGTVGITIGGANYPAILQNDGSYLIQVPFNTDLSSLTVNFTLPAGATSVPANNTAVDFSNGVVFFTVTAANGVTQGTMAVRVQKANEITKALTGVTLSPATLTLDVNEQQVITATAAPSDATQPLTTTFSSDNPAVAGVQADGTVVGRSNGTAIITVTVSNKVNAVSASCPVTVNDTLGNAASTLLSDIAITIAGTDLTAEHQPDGSYLITVPGGTNLSSVLVHFTLPHANATATPASGTSFDFTNNNAMSITVTSANGLNRETFLVRVQTGTGGGSGSGGGSGCDASFGLLALILLSTAPLIRRKK